MQASTNSLVAKAKRFALPAGAAASLLVAGAFLLGHGSVHAASGAAAPMDDQSVSPLISLDNAMEAVTARVTPAVVNVSVTARASADHEMGGDDTATANPERNQQFVHRPAPDSRCWQNTDAPSAHRLRRVYGGSDQPHSKT